MYNVIFNNNKNICMDDNKKLLLSNFYKPNSGTMHYYKFDSEAGFLLDSSGNNKHLTEAFYTWSGGVRHDAASFSMNHIYINGNAYKGLRQDSLNPAGDYPLYCADTGYTSWMDPYGQYSQGQSFTLSFWLYQLSTSLGSSSQYYFTISSQYNFSTIPDNIYGWRNEITIRGNPAAEDGQLMFLVGSSGSAGNYYPTAKSVIKDQWNHVCLTASYAWDGLSMLLYINGEFSHPGAWGNSVLPSTNGLWLMNNIYNSTFYHMDEVIIENRVWSDGEISSYYNTTKPN